MRVLAGALLLTLTACGGATRVDGSDPASQPTFAMDATSCESGRTPDAEAALADQDRSDALAVVEIVFLDECTGAGGNWLIARELDSYRRFFLGAHACRLWTSPPAGRYGVVRYRQTAGQRTTPEGACIAFPGEAMVASDQMTTGIVVFETREGAESFATERGWKRP